MDGGQATALRVRVHPIVKNRAEHTRIPQCPYVRLSLSHLSRLVFHYEIHSSLPTPACDVVSVQWHQTHLSSLPAGLQCCDLVQTGSSCTQRPPSYDSKI